MHLIVLFQDNDSMTCLPSLSPRLLQDNDSMIYSGDKGLLAVASRSLAEIGVSSLLRWNPRTKALLSAACYGPYLLVFPSFLFGGSPHALPTLPPLLS